MACSAPPRGRKRWTLVELERAVRCEPRIGKLSRETVRRMLKKRRQALASGDVAHRRPHRGVSPSYVPLLALYAQPFNPPEPVVCIDEKSLQLAAHSRTPLPMSAGVAPKDDYEYVRKGTGTVRGRGVPSCARWVQSPPRCCTGSSSGISMSETPPLRSCSIRRSKSGLPNSRPTGRIWSQSLSSRALSLLRRMYARLMVAFRLRRDVIQGLVARLCPS